MFNSRKDQRGTLAPSDDIGIADIWKFLVRRRLVVSFGILLGGALGILAYFKAPRLYTATVIVEMNRDASGLPDLSGVSELIGEESGFMTDMLTQQAVLTGDSTALSVIKRLGLMSQPPYNSLAQGAGTGSVTVGSSSQLERDSKIQDRALGIFKSGLRTAPVKNTRLLAVSYTDKDPVRAELIANAVVEAYQVNHTKTRYDATARASAWLTDQLDALKKNSDDTHLKVSNLEKKSGVFTNQLNPSKEDGASPESINSSPEYQRLSNMNQELSRAEITRIEKEAIYRLAESNDPGLVLGLGGTSLVTAAGGALDPNRHSMQVLQTLRSQEAALKIRLAAERVNYGAKNPIILEIQQQIEAVHTQMAEELKGVNAQTKAEYLLAKANEDALRKGLGEAQAHLISLGDDLSALSFLREEEAGSRRLYQDLYRRLEEANIAAGVRSSGLTVDDPARVPSSTSSPVLKSYLISSVGAGFLFGILIGLLLQARDTLLYAPEDFEKNSLITGSSSSSQMRTTPVPMLGVIPSFDSGPAAAYYRSKETTLQTVKDQAWIIRAPRSQFAEAFRQIRTAILLSSIDNPPRVILITSPLSGSGKTTTAYNLAAAFATQSANVLLVGADMRRPDIPKISGCQRSNGLSDVLSNRVTLGSALQQHELLPSLKILQAGTIPPDPAELLGSKRFAELIRELRSTFEYILVDAPPVIPVTDAVVAGASVDAVLAVVRAGKTSKPDLKEMFISLDKPTINILGFVVNDFHGALRSYTYEAEGSNEQKRARNRKE